jgi:hypothetical protein
LNKWLIRLSAVVFLGCASSPKNTSYTTIIQGDEFLFRPLRLFRPKPSRALGTSLTRCSFSRPDIRKKFRAVGFAIDIIGKNQVLSDLPYYAHLRRKNTGDGRAYDTGTRVLAAERSVPSVKKTYCVYLSSLIFKRTS